jgi:hypothetical protein
MPLDAKQYGGRSRINQAQRLRLITEHQYIFAIGRLRTYLFTDHWLPSA